MSGDNGQAQVGQGPKVKPLLTIAITEDKKLVVIGPLENKEMCLHALSDAIKIVASHNPSPIVVPKVNVDVTKRI